MIPKAVGLEWEILYGVHFIDNESGRNVLKGMR